MTDLSLQNNQVDKSFVEFSGSKIAEPLFS
jgi:hypothetical protein